MAEDGLALQPQPPGAIMAHHCIQFATMVQLRDNPSHASIPSLLALLARSAELAHIHIRQGLRHQLQGGTRVCLMATLQIKVM
jgi:Sec63 Brl domain